MTKYLMLFGIVATMFLAVIFVKNIRNKKLKYTFLISPLIIGGILYSFISLLTKNMPPDVCDGAAIIGVLLSFILIGIGILLNIIHILYLILAKKD